MLRIFKRQIFRYIRSERGLNTWSPLATAFNSTVDENYAVNVSRKEMVSVLTFILYTLLTIALT